MEYAKPKKKTGEIISAAGISLLIHFAVAVFLIFGLSGNLTSQPKLNGINLVWISLNSLNTKSEVVQSVKNRQQLPAAKTTAQKPVNNENKAYKKETEQINAVAAQESMGTAKPELAAASGSGMKELSVNITGQQGINHAVEKAIKSDTVIAYPLYKENAPPAYPEIARARGYEGVVLVSAQILPDGRVGEIKIRKSSGYAILDQSAIQAVRPWKFEPAKKSGNPFTAWVELPIKFILHNDGSHS